MEIFTIGHSTHSAEEFCALLTKHEIQLLADIRRFPGSRKFPHFNRENLVATLTKTGIEYRWLEELGGRRKGGRTESSPNIGLRNESFRNYADYALTPPFRKALRDLEKAAELHRPAIMCAETLWWRCHRRIITDYLLADGNKVVHILGPGKTEPGRLTEAAMPQADGTLLYPGDPATPRIPGL